MLRGGDLAEPSPGMSPVPDLSLHISPPNSSTPSSISAEQQSSINFDIWGQFDSPNGRALKSLCSDSSRLKEADTELSLARSKFPSSPLEAQSPWRSLEEHNVDGSFKKRNIISHGGINSLLGLSEKLQPITGTPVYDSNNTLCNGAAFPFSSMSVDYNCCFPRSYLAFASPTTGPRHRNRAMMMESMVESQQQLPYHGRGGNLDFSSNNRLRFTPRPQANRRNVRAPRMRWTTSLHARFVHAVEHLGGHESKLLINIIKTNLCRARL